MNFGSLKFILIIVGLIFINNQLLFSQSILSDTTSSGEGKLKITSNLEEFLIVVDEDYENYQVLSSGDEIVLTSGKHLIRIIWRTVRDNTFEVNVTDGKTILKSVQFAEFSTNAKSSYSNIVRDRKNIEITTDKKSEIYINGEFKGTGKTELLIAPGKHKLFIKHPKYGELNRRFKVSLYKTKEIEVYNKNPNPLPTYLNFVPTVDFLSNGEYFKAGLSYLTLGFVSYKLFNSIGNYNYYSNEYDSAIRNYNSSTSSAEAIYYRLNAREQIDEIQKFRDGIILNSTIIGVLYAIITIDSFIKPRSGYSNKGIKFTFITHSYGESKSQIGLRYGF